ncbi:MAG: hypothetical protein DCC67_19525 [Planctomycetota bacterium]|nr:MAG: hypothetical protein DCC67_19525 [Planctomycetota bacterium]
MGAAAAEHSDYRWLIESQAAASLLANLGQDARPALTLLTDLRGSLSSERARLIVEQVALRRRAAAKFGPAAASMFFTPIHLEQATDMWVAAYKASRFAALGDCTNVHDFCCGIGGDAAALAGAGPCAGYDASSVACWMAEANVRRLSGNSDRFTATATDVSPLLPAQDEAWHVDPDRRPGGRRTTTLENYSPGPEVIERWFAASPDGAVKLAPAASPPPRWQAGAELEWISSHRECRQMVAWFGRLATAPGWRKATVLTTAGPREVRPSTFVGMPERAAAMAAEPGAWLFDPDPSLVAAGLVGACANQYGLATLGFGGVYLTGDQPVDEPLLRMFAVQDCLPLRAKTVARYLAARGVGHIEIKTRGVDVDPARFRQELKLCGDNCATVLLTRIVERRVAIVAERCDAAS